MKLNLIKLSRKIMDNNNIPSSERTKVLQLALAEAIAKTVNIPSEPLEVKPSEHFLDVYKNSVIRQLCTINEMIVIDIDQTCDLVYHMWEIRYLFVHDTNNSKVARLASTMLAANNSHIPAVYRELAEKHPKAFFNNHDMKESVLPEEEIPKDEG